MPGPGSSEGDRRSPSSPLVHRQVVLLVVLCAVAVVLFALTRSLASWSQETMAREAAAAYTRGVAAERAGELTRAIEEFRRAVFNDRDNRTYTLHLARVLADGGHRDEAERLLLRLREAAPDDSEINYRLARLAAFRHDVQTAVRYYNHAMYGLAADGATLDRRRIRVELIHVLLDAGDREAALPELTALSRELPDEVEAQLEAGRLSARAGQTRVALERFRQAAAIDPTHAEAQVGAGTSALALYDFRAAIQHFDAALRLGAGGDRLANNLAVARLADASDPLAPALPIAERARRLDAGFDWLAGQVEACPAADIRAPADVQADRTPAEGDRPEALPDSDVLRFGVLRSQPQRALRDSDVIAEGVGLIGRLHATVTRVCPGEAPISQAWTLIAQAHPGEVR